MSQIVESTKAFQPATMVCAAHTPAVAKLYAALTAGQSPYYDAPPHSPWPLDAARWHRDFRFRVSYFGAYIHICAEGSDKEGVGVTHIVVTLPGHLHEAAIRYWLAEMGVRVEDFAAAHINSDVLSGTPSER